MLVEFIGFSSSGKTTLVKRVCADLAQKKTDFNLIQLDYLNRKYNSKLNQKLLSLFINLKTILFFVLFLLRFRNMKNIFFLLKQTNVSFWMKITYLRNYIKKLSLIHFYKKRKIQNSKKILVFDEGFIQCHLNILIHVKNVLDLDGIDFISCPDLIVYLKPDKSEIFNRIKKRSDRKQWNSLSRKETDKYIDRFNFYMDKFIENYYNNNNVLKISDKNYDSEVMTKLITNKISEINQGSHGK